MKIDFPPLTDDERARMVDDYSDAAVERWAREMLERKHPLEAAARADQYRSAFPASSPGASFWSRVQVRLLCPRLLDSAPAVNSDQANPPTVPARASMADTPPAARATAYPIAGAKAAPSPKDPEQGSLF